MKFWNAILAVSVGLAGPVLSMPSADSGLDVAGESPNLVARDPLESEAEVEVEAIKRTDEEGDGHNSLTKRGAVNDLLQRILNEVNSGSLNFNQVAQDGVALFNQSVASVDLNQVVRTTYYMTSAPVRPVVNALPGGIIIKMVVKVLKTLFRQINFNSISQPMLSMTARFVAKLDFNSAIKAGLESVIN